MTALPPAAEVAETIGVPLDDWAGSCHGISMAVAPLVGGVVRRGYFTGTVDPDSYFGRIGGVGQHSWIELPDGTVVDPTRHAITGTAPELWHGPADEYDIGGCKSQAPASGPPPNALSSNRGSVMLMLGCVDYVLDLLGYDVFDWSRGEDDTWVEVSQEQALWLANLPVKENENDGVLARWFAAEVYEALCDAGQRALIPIDRLDWIAPDLRERSPRGR